MATTSTVGLHPWYLVQHSSRLRAMDVANLATFVATVLVRTGAGAAVMVPHVEEDSSVVSSGLMRSTTVAWKSPRSCTTYSTSVPLLH